MNLRWLKLKGKAKGVFSGSPDLLPLVENGDSSPYFGAYEGQRLGPFDTDCCWDFSGAEVAETRITMLIAFGKIPADSLAWLHTNGYFDNTGDMYLSRRWVAILSGARDNGNNQINFWNIASVAGLIPHWMLPYDENQAFKYKSKSDFNNDYFNPDVITPAMRQMGQEFLRRFGIYAEMIGNDSTTLQTYLREGSLQIGIPVPQNGSWNQLDVQYPKGRTFADHAVELYKYDVGAYPYKIYDSYEPHLKGLSANYYVPLVTRVVITPKQVAVPVPVSNKNPSLTQQFWLNVWAWLKGQPFPYPNVPVGRG